jgi:RNA polymerase sigma-70 factor (ECF subfamily)
MHILDSPHNVRDDRFILRIVRDATMAEDLVSQVFLDVWRTASQFEGRSQVSTWLLSIARFKALTALRQRRHEDIDQEDMLEIADDADTPEASLDRSTTSAILRACVAKLSPAHREIINLVYYHEKSVEEVGAIIGIPQSTVKTRMFYARKQLADLLKVAGVEEATLFGSFARLRIAPKPADQDSRATGKRRKSQTFQRDIRIACHRAVPEI